MISIAEQIDVPSPPKRVWEVISDPSTVVSCVGGAELGELHDDGSFDAVLVVRFGGIRVRFAARTALELDEEVREGRLTARGRDGQGATRFNGGAVFRVAEDPATGGTQVTMNGEMNLSGKLATLIESGAGVVVTKMTREFSAALVEACADPASPVADNVVGVETPRPNLWQRIRERLARLLHRGSSALPQSGRQPDEHAPASPPSADHSTSSSSPGGRP
ncbi:SRPBCC domain-containing protein [Streptomyces sp. NPDC048425]|uniref:SRPBCC domain-containing protein n=1 Tax=Streptomyces sp. NPDC048425 TaxID=3365548 RepID=UPI00371615F0